MHTRQEEMDEDLAAFPYVNGGFFADENIEIPRLGDRIIDLILPKANVNFDWSGINLTIFSVAFESTLNPKTRRSSVMHYTSIENIHKVIEPLFLEDLQKRLAKLSFLDPARSSGNFLTETYISLRRIETNCWSFCTISKLF